MKRLTFIALLALPFTFACATIPQPPTPQPTPPPVVVPAPPTTTTHTLAATVRIAGSPAGVPMVVSGFAPDHGTSSCSTNEPFSRITCESVVPPDTGGGWLSLSAEGYVSQTLRLELDGDLNLEMQPVVVNVDSSAISLEELSRIRGSMWTARMNLPYGPRPNQDSNINALVFYGSYDAPTKARMLADYRAHGYTHGVSGPITGNDCYHGLWPCRIGVPTQAEWDAYLDDLQDWYNAGIKPIYFAHPDGMDDPAQMAQLDALYRQPRAQKLIRIVVYTGWEPWDYNLSNAQWVAWLKRGADVFPNALRLVHTVSDIDALVGGPSDPMVIAAQTQGWGPSWRAATPYIHGWLVQVGGYAVSGTLTPDFLSEFAKLWDNSDGSLTSRFRRGTYGWPRGSAWGPNTPLKVYAAEYAAYADTWKNAPEAESIRLGDLAIASGADGYLDGGSVDVP